MRILTGNFEPKTIVGWSKRATFSVDDDETSKLRGFIWSMDFDEHILRDLFPESNAFDSFSSLLDVSPELKRIWAEHIPAELCSLSNSGRARLFLHGSAMKLPQLDRSAFANYDATGVMGQGASLRKLTQYIHTKQYLFVLLQNFLATHSDASHGHLAIHAFFESITNLTRKCEDQCKHTIRESLPERCPWKPSSSESNQQVSRYAIAHYHDRSEPEQEFTHLAEEVQMPTWRLRNWIQKKWKKLHDMLQTDGPAPKWVPKDITRGRLCELLQRGPDRA
jgi:hypothetical protein